MQHPPANPENHGDEGSPLQSLQRRFSPVVAFVRTEIFGSIVLVAAAACAIIWANSPWHDTYEFLVHGKLSVAFEGRTFTHSAQHWVNDGLMTLFFFLIGLEIKRELVTGRLRDRRAAVLPAMAAIGGMAIPALCYAAFNAGGPASHGWAVPMATDIAFAIGLLGLLRDRVPAELRLFLLTTAILDDIGSILIIAMFYSKGISLGWLLAVAAVPILLHGMRWFGVRRIVWYVIVGVFAWVCTLMSGVHPTIAGVIVGMMTPAKPIDGIPVLENLEHLLHPWVAFFVVPVFALANAGVRLDPAHLSDAMNRQVSWGIATGLVVGKTIGVAVFTWIGLRIGIGKLPEDIQMKHIVALAPLSGVGFTVALVIGDLSFEDPSRLDAAKIAILLGSVVAGALGLLLLWRVGVKPARP